MVLHCFSSVQFSSVAQSCPTLCSPMNSSTPGLPVHYQLLESTQTHVHWVGDAIQPSHPLLSPSPPALNLSQHQGLFQRISSSLQVAKYWSFSFSISPSNEHPGLISFRMDWLDLLSVQGTLKSLLQHLLLFGYFAYMSYLQSPEKYPISVQAEWCKQMSTIDRTFFAHWLFSAFVKFSRF